MSDLTQLMREYRRVDNEYVRLVDVLEKVFADWKVSSVAELEALVNDIQGDANEGMRADEVLNRLEGKYSEHYEEFGDIPADAPEYSEYIDAVNVYNSLIPKYGLAELSDIENVEDGIREDLDMVTEYRSEIDELKITRANLLAEIHRIEADA